MALKDIVFEQSHSHAAERGNVGAVSDHVSDAAMEVLFRSGVLQRWNAALSKWEVLPLRYKAGDGWV